MSGLREVLTEIAYDPSTGARSKLLASLSDLVFDHRNPTAEEVASLCAVAKLLLGVADETARCHFATTVAPSKHVPRDVVFMLIEDEIDIASPILRKSPVLTDEDLRSIAETMGDDRLVLIAQRSGLGADIVEVLAGRGGEPVQLAVSENSGAKLSPKALEILIHNAKSNESLCRSLVRRQEVSKVDAEQLVQLITKMLKARMKASEEASKAASAEVIELEAAKPKKPAPRLEIGEIIAALKAGRLSPELALTRLADDDRFNDLTVLISHLTHVDDVSVMRLIVRADINGIGMILKAIEIPDEAFASIIQLRKRRLKSSDVQMRYEREDYAKLSLTESKAALSQLNGTRRK